MSRMLAATGLIACVMLGGCHHRVDRTAIATLVKADAESIVAAVNARDAKKACAFDGPDYVGLFHGGANTVGPDADLRETTKLLADPNVRLETKDPTVDVARRGDVAVYRTTYALTTTDAKTGEPITEHGNWVLVWKRQDDGWKISLEVIVDGAPPKA